MNSYSSSATSRKETIRFDDSVLKKNARIMKSFRNCSNDCWSRRTKTKSEGCRSKSSAQRSDGSSECSSRGDGDDRETCYVSLFQVCMSYVFPRAFPLPSTEYRFRVKSDRLLSDPTNKIIGKILTPVDKCSKIPKGVFLLTPSEDGVIKIYCPGAKIRRKRSKCRNNK
ncbi:unnamed protein product [Aphis gossypii]|uniref:Uncharacterized protein n=1 Tax=Aphis gossypii TaxID=80765 RepID=A0A9P0J992_APHGO|nr:unnamed protein product [Aphis gossypii]